MSALDGDCQQALQTQSPRRATDPEEGDRPLWSFPLAELARRLASTATPARSGVTAARPRHFDSEAYEAARASLSDE